MSSIYTYYLQNLNISPKNQGKNQTSFRLIFAYFRSKFTHMVVRVVNLLFLPQRVIVTIFSTCLVLEIYLHDFFR